MAKKKKVDITADDVLANIDGVISINVPEPNFSSQAKVKLSGKPVEDAIYTALVREFNRFINDKLTEDQRKTIAKRIADNARIRTAAEVAKTVKKKSILQKVPSNMPTKLKECSKPGHEYAELYICEGDSACFVGATEIQLVDGRTVTIKELYDEYLNGAQNYIWASDKGKLKAVPVSEVKFVKKNAEVYKYKFDDGSEVICTPDHKFMLTDGSYKKIKDVTKDDQLMTFTFTVNEFGRNCYHGTKLYKIVAEQYLGEKPKYYHTHHIDGNKKNDTPENLIYIDPSEHSALHGDHESKRNFGKLHKERMENDPEYREKFVGYAKKHWKDYWGQDIHRQEQSKRTKDYFKDEEHRKKTSIATHIGMQKMTKEQHLSRREKQNQTCSLSMLKDAIFYKKTIKFSDLEKLTKEEYEKLKENSSINKGLTWGYETFKQKIKELDNLEELIKNANHRLISCEKVDNEDVYDLFVPPYLNYRLANGLIVHNCGSILAARDARYQAVMPIRGKILNVLKLDLSKKKQRERFEKNGEINDIIKALGSGIGTAFNEDKLRYGKVIFACFTGDTKVKSIDGDSYSFDELVNNGVKELWVYARDSEGNVTPARATNIRRTRTTDELIELTLDNGEKIKCTPDHNFMLDTGDYIQAGNISLGESLMSLYTRVDDEGHGEYYDINKDKWVRTYETITNYFDNKEQKEELKVRDNNYVHSYNYSALHDNDVSEINIDEDCEEGTNCILIGKSIAYLLKNGYPVDEYYYNFYKHKQAVRFDEIVNYFSSVDVAVIFAKSRKWDFGEYVIASEFMQSHESKFLKLKAKISKVILELEELKLEFNKINYDEHRSSDLPEYETITKLFGSYKAVVEYAHNISHKVVDIKRLNVDKEDVYCMNVDEYHNFLLDSGVFVKNCDSDFDGLAIDTLLLGVFYKLFKPMIEQGRVYQCLSPLFEIKYKEKGKEQIVYANTEKERIEILNKLDKRKIKYEIARAKGLGEINADVFHDYVLNPVNRRLIRITIDDAEEANRMIHLAIGNGTPDERKQWMVDHKEIIDDLGLYL